MVKISTFLNIFTVLYAKRNKLPGYTKENGADWGVAEQKAFLGFL
jgi:hypothetical protein